MLRSINMKWPEEFVEALDKERGLVSRSAYVKAAIEGFSGKDMAAFSAARSGASGVTLPRTRPKPEFATTFAKKKPGDFECSMCEYRDTKPGSCPEHGGSLLDMEKV